MAKRSPLSPGAYGKPQRWHEILTDAADARAAKRENERRRNAEASESALLVTGAAAILIAGSSS